jgi:hypothetical protein
VRRAARQQRCRHRVIRRRCGRSANEPFRRCSGIERRQRALRRGGRAASASIAGEVDGLVDRVAQQRRCGDVRLNVTGVDVLNELTVAALPDGAQLELGSSCAGEPGGWS